MFNTTDAPAFSYTAAYTIATKGLLANYRDGLMVGTEAYHFGYCPLPKA
jgi:hypothetical protein